MPYKGAFQSTFLGTAIRFVSRNRLVKYPDETDFPERYTKESVAEGVGEGTIGCPTIVWPHYPSTITNPR